MERNLWKPQKLRSFNLLEFKNEGKTSRSSFNSATTWHVSLYLDSAFHLVRTRIYIWTTNYSIGNSNGYSLMNYYPSELTFQEQCAFFSRKLYVFQILTLVKYEFIFIITFTEYENLCIFSFADNFLILKRSVAKIKTLKKKCIRNTIYTPQSMKT